MYKDRLTFISKKISYALRHHPEEYRLKPDSVGSVPLDSLIRALNAKHKFDIPVTEDDIREIIISSEKRRFEIYGGRIRATYGHSFPVKIKYDEVIPPDVLYHGTSHDAARKIEKEGLKPMDRQYVHLSTDIPRAVEVGKRRDKDPVIFKIDAARAVADGLRFYYAADRTYLADEVPPEYLEIVKR